MFTVAPIGRTNDEIRFETPTRSSAVRIVTGSVAAAELVEKAISSGLRRFLKWMAGDMRASTMSDQRQGDQQVDGQPGRHGQEVPRSAVRTTRTRSSRPSG